MDADKMGAKTASGGRRWVVLSEAHLLSERAQSDGEEDPSLEERQGPFLRAS